MPIDRCFNFPPLTVTAISPVFNASAFNNPKSRGKVILWFRDVEAFLFEETLPDRVNLEIRKVRAFIFVVVARLWVKAAFTINYC